MFNIYMYVVIIWVLSVGFMFIRFKYGREGVGIVYGIKVFFFYNL